MHSVINRYVRNLGWPLLVRDDGVFLPGGLDIVGLRVHAGLAGEVNTEIRRREIVVPILAVPHHWIFLTEEPYQRLPPNVAVARGPIPLPPTEVDGVVTRWVSAPTSNVPPAAVVVDAIRFVQRKR
ncbi:hypothetical protein Lesp02_37400 [Lentzea sp. NBRC 105346]|uniref:hypothetical protein n=1 Tax=Lentzea sp. NBRC 105346 TaxID=3032205 RepID=UPI0024A42E81|nr:hypothetical protein [Lentzea sp. NBRC 105346]GLZ31552.1 hypothetical protein Lesp02_37400 [Lentzea sp. NBRC 105346]